MKIWAIFLLLYILNTFLIVFIDLVTGISLKHSLVSLLQPFKVKKVGEVVTIFILLSFWIAGEFVSYLQNENKTKSKS